MTRNWPNRRKEYGKLATEWINGRITMEEEGNEDGGFLGLGDLFSGYYCKNQEFQRYLGTKDCEEGAPCEYCTMGGEDLEKAIEEVLEKRLEATLKEHARKIGLLKCDGLGNHNKSIDLVTSCFSHILKEHASWVNSLTKAQIAKDVIDLRPPSIVMAETRKDEIVELEFKFHGKHSGVRYIVTGLYNPSNASLLAGKIEEIFEADNKYSDSQALKAFTEAADFMTFRVSYHDPFDPRITGAKSYLCIEGGDDSPCIWPGDNLASVIMCLYDDLTTALDPSMYTLRNELMEASKKAYLAGESKITIHRLMAYHEAYKDISKWYHRMPEEELEEMASAYKSQLSDPDWCSTEPIPSIASVPDLQGDDEMEDYWYE